MPKNTLGEGTYTAKHIIVATGARPRALPGIEPDGKLIWTYFEAMKPEKMPKSLWSWARAPSASNSHRSTAPWAST
jgi:dihydrolipoamide dehydrogenase